MKRLERSEFTAVSGERRCGECGKVFFVGDITTWAYRIPRRGSAYKWFCSWGCLCGWRKKHEKRLKSDICALKSQTYEPGLFPNNLKEIRQYFGLKRVDLVAYLSCSKSTYFCIEVGARPIQSKWMERLCEAYGCKPHDITGGTFDPDTAMLWDCPIKQKSTHPTR
ncbi:MAG: helix-turn-helix transcriptional regulator [Clostridia bacterium]|nr:helix-turn-helix transcriptional regulator [Clostridia bacterium]